MYRDPYDDTAQPICPACGVTMHPLLDEGLGADECRECGFRLEWSEPDASGPARTGDRWAEGWG
ncbi:zf-TFIIB domain-containing protein [Microbacterium trichothecenolyticum]|uniref:Transcription factor zinc-finger domain-containing protein n=1 Tax=Microbacterium trichothecenolyticum TaxID=69370 RepID=A0ABU0TY69_MICTR|nr:zf-TFIIB domain-containing protein [Microbacterium trichothecenolyticum]MDQ1124612.1 hypothetical protein [Microbacterium trichothecenolyticum]